MKIHVSLFKDKETGEYVSSVTGKTENGKSTFKVFDGSKFKIIEVKKFEIPDEKKTLSDKKLIEGYDYLGYEIIRYPHKAIKKHLKNFMNRLIKNDYINTNAEISKEIKKEAKIEFGKDLL